MNLIKRNRKGQMWISDYTLSILLFIAALFIAFKILLNGFTANSTFADLRADASKISEVFMSEGFPVSWTNESVIKPGLLLDGRLDFSKTSIAMNSTMMNYSRFKGILQTKYDFLVMFENSKSSIVNFSNSCSIGNPDAVVMNISGCRSPDFSGINYDNMVHVTRYAVYNGTIVRMVIYLWD